MSNWFEIDKAGLAKILERKGKEFALFELVQNAWDENGVNTVNVTLVAGETPGYAMLSVEDNAPNGFANLDHAYTLFAESNKKSNPEQRGRFNLGEKLVLAMAREASVATTSGTVVFNKAGRRRFPSFVRPVGSEIKALVKMNKSETEQAIKAFKKLMPPSGITTSLNGETLTAPVVAMKFTASLPTEIADSEGNLVRTTRMTEVRVINASEEVPAAIYEMGIPVCEIDGKYIFDVAQKIPLTMDREEVLPSFRKQLSVAAVNNIKSMLDSNDANTTWATEATTSPNIAPAALDAVITQRFGAKRVIYDPSDIEANSRAVAEGYTVITGGQLSKEAWNNVRSFGTALPAGQVTPSPKPYHKDGKPLTLAEMTDDMRSVEKYAKLFANVVLNASITVTFAAEVTWPYAATYGPGHLTFNVGTLSKAWFNLRHNQQEIDDLLIHEFGHHYCSNHLSKDYYDALTSIGSRLAQAVRAGKL